MNNIPLSALLLSCLLLGSCSALRTSKYSKHNEFTYDKEQPRFNFKNDPLDIEGAWHWATSSRAIPKLSYIPNVHKRILRPIAKEHGSVLFATWTPRKKKYSVEGKVAVTKKDVRFTDKNNDPFFITVFVNDKSFSADTLKYKPRGRNNDYQFRLYQSEPGFINDSLWIMETIAAGANRYYNFVCIADKEFGSTPKSQAYQAERFLEDIKIRFLEQE